MKERRTFLSREYGNTKLLIEVAKKRAGAGQLESKKVAFQVGNKEVGGFRARKPGRRQVARKEKTPSLGARKNEDAFMQSRDAGLQTLTQGIWQKTQKVSH